MNVQQFLLALRGRFWIFLSLLCGTVAAAVIVTMLLPRTYEATVSLLVDNRDEQSLAGTMPNPRDRTGFMQTQIDIINSMEVARRVVEDLKLNQSPAAKAYLLHAQNALLEWVAG